MADMYTPEEIQRIFDEYHDAVRRGIPISAQLAKEMADATKGVKRYTDTLNSSLKQLGQASAQAAKDIANGAKGASTFNNSIGAAGDVVANVASQFGVLGNALGLAVKALTFFVSAVNKQSDALYTTFQNLSRSGAAGVQGMQDVFQSAQKMGYTIDELDKMASMLSENSKSFAMFSGTAATGSSRLGDMVLGLESVREKLFNLGMTSDDIAKASAGYYRQMGRLGRVTEANTAGALAYIREMETLTRLTGQQRKEMEEQREAAEEIDQFYAALMDMDPAAAKNAYSVFNQLMALDPSGKKARAFAKSMDGIIDGSDEQTQAIMSTNGEFLKFASDLKEGRLSDTQFMQQYGDAVKGNIGVMKELGRLGVSDVFGSLKNNAMQANKATQGFGTQMGKAQAEVAGLEKGLDPATAEMSHMRNQQLKASQSLQEFINVGINPVTKAMSILADVIEKLTSFLPGAGASKQRYEEQQKRRAQAEQTGEHATGGAAAPAGGGNIPAPPTEGGGPVAPKGGTRSLGAPGGTTGTGLSGADTSGLASDFASRFKAAAAEYYAITGQEVRVTSAYRDPAKQAELYQAWVEGKSKFPAAPPGRSLHEQGQAVDVDLASANKMDQLGLLAKYGLRRPVAGDPIHIQARSGFEGVLSGPTSGYRPNITMHGTEELSIKPVNSVAQPGSSASLNEGLMAKLAEKLDEMIYIGKAQLGVEEKILRAQV